MPQVFHLAVIAAPCRDLPAADIDAWQALQRLKKRSLPANRCGSMDWKKQSGKADWKKKMTIEMEEKTDQQILAELITAAQDGDREAFGELVTRFEGAVYAIALRQLHNHAEAEELTQDVFVQAYGRLHQLREAERFGGWLRSITVRLAINRRTRRRQPVSADPEIFEATWTDSNSPVDTVLERERADGLHSGLNRLGDLDRETLVAFYLKGQSLVEMSDAFASPVGTIKRRLHVARKRLAVELQELAAV